MSEAYVSSAALEPPVEDEPVTCEGCVNLGDERDGQVWCCRDEEWYTAGLAYDGTLAAYGCKEE